MFSALQELLVVIGGFTLIVILSWVLALVHKQAKKMNELEAKLNSVDNARNTKESK